MSWLAQTGRCPRVPAWREVSCGGFGCRHGDCGVAGSALGHAGRCMQPPLSAGVFSLLHPAKQCLRHPWNYEVCLACVVCCTLHCSGRGRDPFSVSLLCVSFSTRTANTVANEIYRSGTALEHILLCGFHAVAAGVFIVQFARQFRRGTLVHGAFGGFVSVHCLWYCTLTSISNSTATCW